MYAADLINKKLCWLKVVLGDLIDTHFDDKEVGDFGIIEARTEDNKLFKIFSMKETDYVMNILAGWKTVDGLEGKKTGRCFMERSVTKENQNFTYRKPFGIYFRYRHQYDNHNNHRHAQLYL